MLKNIYTPTAGALAQERLLEVIANNLANVNTTAFKGDTVTFTMLNPEPEKTYASPIPPAKFKFDFDDMMPLRGNEMSYVGVAEMSRDLTQGPALETKNKADLMIEGPGYFAVQTDEGRRFTRAGDFTLGTDGALVTKEGHPVLGDKGIIYVRSGQFEVSHTGEVLQDGQFVDRIALFNFPDSGLERVGHNLMHYGGPEGALTRVVNPMMAQGYLEGSNVNSIKNLTAMIVAHRSFEAYQKAVANYDKMMDKSSNSIGDLRV